MKSEMNVVPYIDVMLVLLVIFMIATPLINRTVDVDLPVAKGAVFAMPQSMPEGALPLLLTVEKDGQYSLNSSGQVYSDFAQVIQAIKDKRAQYPEWPLIVQADKQVSYNRVFSLVMRLKNSGIDAVGMAVTEEADRE